MDNSTLYNRPISFLCSLLIIEDLKEFNFNSYSTNYKQSALDKTKLSVSVSYGTFRRAKISPSGCCYDLDVTKKKRRVLGSFLGCYIDVLRKSVESWTALQAKKQIIHYDLYALFHPYLSDRTFIVKINSCLSKKRNILLPVTYSLPTRAIRVPELQSHTYKFSYQNTNLYQFRYYIDK